MIERVVAKIVSAALRFPWLTIVLGLLLTAGAVAYVGANIAITTDTSQLISPDLDWRQRERQFDAAFPQHTDTINVVIDGITPEIAEKAARDLSTALSKAKPKPLEIVPVARRGSANDGKPDQGTARARHVVRRPDAQRIGQGAELHSIGYQ
jgi:predicted RND superfamily exporter protein